jgi:hypothetical protein
VIGRDPGLTEIFVDVDEHAPEPATRSAEHFPSRRLKRTYAMLGASYHYQFFRPLTALLHPTDVTSEHFERMRPLKQARTASRLLRKLDNRVRPGITNEEFRSLVAKCGHCGLITTKRTFALHRCEIEVIELTDTE